MSSVMLLQDYGLIAVPSRSARHGGADHRVDSVSQSGQNLGSLDVGSAEIWGNLGDFGCYIISFFGKKLGSLDGTYIGIYRGPRRPKPRHLVHLGQSRGLGLSIVRPRFVCSSATTRVLSRISE